jgi:hypothetical protein
MSRRSAPTPVFCSTLHVCASVRKSLRSGSRTRGIFGGVSSHAWTRFASEGPMPCRVVRLRPAVTSSCASVGHMNAERAARFKAWRRTPSASRASSASNSAISALLSTVWILTQITRDAAQQSSAADLASAADSIDIAEGATHSGKNCDAGHDRPLWKIRINAGGRHHGAKVHYLANRLCCAGARV